MGLPWTSQEWLEYGKVIVAKIKTAKQKSPSLGSKLAIDDERQEKILRQTVYDITQALTKKYFYLLGGNSEDRIEANTLHAELVKTADLIGVPYEDLADENGRKWASPVVRALPTKILDEEAKAKPNQQKILEWKDQLIKAADILQYQPKFFTTTQNRYWRDNYSPETAAEYLHRLKQKRLQKSVSDAVGSSKYLIDVEMGLKHPDTEYINALKKSIQIKVENFSKDEKEYAKKIKLQQYSATTHIGADTVRNLLIREYHKEEPDDARVKELKGKLIELEKGQYLGPNITNYFLYGNLRAQRLELRAKYQKVKSAIMQMSDPDKVGELRGQLYQIKVEQRKLIARMGDPLISVQAPDAVSVVALMPDGQTKQLIFDAQKNRWEARFDIPASAAEGEYTIQIIVVRKDGSRQMLQMHYSVDLTPPAGNAQMKVIDKNYSGQKVLRLKVQTDNNAARVSALLPWNAKVELMPSENTSNQFFALTPVPEGYGKRTFPVTFVLTDKAHNRAEITVEQMP